MAVQLAASATAAPLTYKLPVSSLDASGDKFSRMDNKNNNVRVPIPVISQVKNDADIGIAYPTLEKISLAKVIKLLTDPHSVGLVERHVEALRKVIKHYGAGFIMRELPSVFKILNICADRVAEHAAYTRPMLQLLGLCSLPFLQEKSSDHLTYEQIAIECVDQLAYLMRVPESSIRLQICDTLARFCSFQPSIQHGNYQSTSYIYNQRLVEKSEVVQTLVRVLDFRNVNMETKQAVIKLLQMLSKNSSCNSSHLLMVDGAKTLCLHLTDLDCSLQLMFNIAEVLWNILEHGCSYTAAEQLNNVDCVSKLHSAFVDRITQGFSKVEKQLRNDLLVICTLILSHASADVFVQTGFAKQLAVFATFQEVKSHNVLVKHLKFTADHEDFELKKMLINVLVLLSYSDACLEILSECRVVHALFTYIRCYDSLPQSYSPMIWSPAQLEEIALHAMSALCTIAPSMLSDYKECQGGTRLLVMLEWCVSESEYSGVGNGFHSDGGRGSKRAHLYRLIRIIHSVVSTGDEEVLVDFIDQGLITQLICLLEMFINERKTGVRQAEQSADKTLSSDLKLATLTAYRESDADIEIQTDILITLSILCQDDNSRKELFGRSGVDVLCEYLQTETENLSTVCLRLLMVAINTVWSAVIGCYSVEDYFLEKEGVFILMDLLERCPSNAQSQLLGCLLDLLDNAHTLTHIQAWRGAKELTPTQLFCRLWREEEERMGIKRDSHGAISDIQKPLSARKCEIQNAEASGERGSSEAISDVLENIRAKIYAIFCRIGFAVEPGLSAEVHVTLVVIQHYLDLKMGEVWCEIITELSEESVRPITPDCEALEAISSAVQIRSSQIRDLQTEIIESHRQQDLNEEQQYYQSIRDSHKQKERDLQLQAEYIERTSKHMVLKAAKERQDMAIEASRVNTGYASLATVHRTDIPNLNITTFPGRQVTIDHFSNLC